MNHDDPNEELIDLLRRFITSFEMIAVAVKGTYEEAKRVSNRFWPERSELRDARVTRVPNERDKALEEQGATDTRPVREWASSFQDESPYDSVVGLRERQYIIDHPEEEEAGGIPPKAGGQAG